MWLVSGALPGESVEAAVERCRAGVVEARTEKVIKASAWRSSSPCPQAPRCGGCDLDHVADFARAEVLRDVTVGALRHAPRMVAERVSSAKVERAGRSWRLRVRLHWHRATGRAGFFKRQSQEVARLDSCRVISRRLAGFLPVLEKALYAARLADGEVEWIEDLRGRIAVAGWRGRGSPPPRVAELDGFWRLTNGEGGLADGWGAQGVEVSLPTPMFVPVGAFFQADAVLLPRLFERMTSLVREWGALKVVDLYGGVGVFAAAAVRGGACDVTIVEANRLAAAAARRNVPGARVVAGTCEGFMKRRRTDRNVVVIADPPRAGLSRQVRNALLEWAPRRVVLLSCDAARFGRDAEALLAAGYDLGEIELWDMFPGTHHVEILSTFERRGE